MHATGSRAERQLGDRQTERAGQAEALTFRVTGMVCAGCAAKVQRALEQQPAVDAASVNVATGRAVITPERSAVPDLVVLADAIRRAGFGAEPLSGGASPQEMLGEIELRQQQTQRQWRRRAITGLSLWVPMETLHWSAHLMHWHLAWMDGVMFTGATAALLLVGSGFYRSAWSSLRRGTTNMDTLISMGATAAYGFSLVVWILKLRGATGLPPMYFAESAALLGIISLGHWLEARATARAGSAVRELLQMQPDEAEVLQADGTTVTRPSAEVTPGMRLLIRPGSRLPIDGQVAEGDSEVDESVVTGESLPVIKQPGDAVVAGSVNTTGRLVVVATVGGRDTTIARIAEMVQTAQSSKARVQRLADAISAIFVPTVITVAAVTLLGWYWFGGAGGLVTGVIAAVTVLIISCPCALGLATPMAVMVGSGAASRQGLLVKSASVLERAGRVGQVVFDKTGTLTRGAPSVIRVDVSGEQLDESALLRLAAAAERPSEHPIGRAIVVEAEARDLRPPQCDDFAALPGRGVQATVEGCRVEVLRDDNASCAVLVNGQRQGTITVRDTVRDDARLAVSRLTQMGIAVRMLTGDRRPAALGIAAQIGLAPEQVEADATPESKAALVASLPPGSAMVGDGINDAAALARADLGIAIASGTNIAIDSADVVIPGESVMAVPQTIGLARRTLRTIKQNLVFAFMYNVAAIPLAAFGLLGHRGPLVAAVAMALSDLMVVGNALRLKRQLDRTPAERM